MLRKLLAIAALLASNTEIAQSPIDAVSRVRLMLDAYMRFGLENPNTYWLTFCSSADGSTSTAFRAFTR